jgi:2-methylcitrate dehydratase
MRGEMGYRLVLSAPVWGFNDVFYRRAHLSVKRDFAEYVIENTLFKARGGVGARGHRAHRV